MNQQRIQQRWYRSIHYVTNGTYCFVPIVVSLLLIIISETVFVRSFQRPSITTTSTIISNHRKSNCIYHIMNQRILTTKSTRYRWYHSKNNNNNDRILHQQLLPLPKLLSSSQLYMAGGKSSLNKQAALRQKLQQAKQQNSMTQQQDAVSSSSSSSILSDKEIRERNDRLRFEELLFKKGNLVSLNDDNDMEYKSQQQEEDEIDAVRSGKDLLFEGDPAPTDCFEELVSIKTENAIGESGKQRIVPWFRKSFARQQDYIIVLTDPRIQSTELRESMKLLTVRLPKDILQHLMVVNADSPAENRRWLKKLGGVSGSNDASKTSQSLPSSSLFEIYSDEKMEFMRTYTALGDTRWSMSMYIIASQRIQKLVRNVDQYTVVRTIQNAVTSYLKEIKL